MALINLPICYMLLGIFSLAIGSFLNVVIYRLPIMLHAEWQEEIHNFLSYSPKRKSRLNLFLPRSFCPSCKTKLTALYNIPLISYFFLKGCCRHCQQPISLRYPLVELISCMLALLTAWQFGFNPNLVFSLLFIWILLALFFIDLEQQLLPDSLTLGLLWLGLIANTQSLFTPLSNAVFGAAAAYLSLWSFNHLFFWLRGKIGMGHGDFKLFAALGAWLGWMKLPFILFFASALGAIIGGVVLIIQGKNYDYPIPFGPFLCLASVTVFFYGEKFIQWYLNYCF